MGSNLNAEVQNQRDQKRGYQWLMNASEQELLLNKKQAIELVNSTPSGDSSNLTDYLWCSNEQLVPSDSCASRNLVEINFLEKFGNDHSFRSSMSEDQIVVLEPIHSTAGINSLVLASDNVYDSFTRPYYISWIQNKRPLYEQTLNRGSANVRPTGHTYSNCYNHFTAVNHCYNRATRTIPVNGLRYLDNTTVSFVRSQPSANVAQSGYAVNNNERSTVAFGSFNGYNHREVGTSSNGVISNVYANQPFSEGMMNRRDVNGRLNETYEAALTSRPVDIVEKNEEERRTKKTRNNSFPLNVKSLLLTGILDGVPVKYVPWSREKSLRGVIKGPGYMCSCEECKLSKASESVETWWLQHQSSSLRTCKNPLGGFQLKCISAYEFEIHAGFKTNHPNDHIYFPNGKTVYRAVLELKATPRDQLFDAIENMTGSTINQENFLKWKASYQAQIAKVLGANMAS